MKQIIWGAGILVFSALCIGAAYFFPEAHADDGTQSFMPANYSLLAADVTAGQVEDMQSTRVRRCVFLLNNRTGQTWVLQLSVFGGNDPTVQNAVWAPVSPSGPFSVRGNN